MKQNTNQLKILIVLILNFDYKGIAAQTYGSAPIITPDKRDITALPSENITFTCHAAEPVTWKFFDVNKFCRIVSLFDSLTTFDF